MLQTVISILYGNCNLYILAGKMHSSISRNVQATSVIYPHTKKSSNFNNTKSATSFKQINSENKILSRIEDCNSVNMIYKQKNSNENCSTTKLLSNGDDQICYSTNNTIPGTNSSPLSTTTINRRSVTSRSTTFG